MLEAIVLGVVLLSPPLPPLPVFPPFPEVEQVEIEIAMPEHAEDFEDQVEEAQAQVDAIMAPAETMTEILSEWTGEMPDASEGDFDTGLSPIQSYGNAYAFAEEMGTQSSGLFVAARAITQFPDWFIWIAVEILACTAWLFLTRFITFMIAVADMLFSVIVAAWSMVPFKSS